MKRSFLLCIFIMFIFISCSTTKKIITVPFDNVKYDLKCQPYVKIINVDTNQEILMLVDTGSYINHINSYLNSSSGIINFRIVGSNKIYTEEFKSKDDNLLSPEDGIIGLGFLMKFAIVEFDFKTGTITLNAKKKNTDYYKYHKIIYGDKTMHITLPVYFNEECYDFVFDTGFSANANIIGFKNPVYYGLNFDRFMKIFSVKIFDKYYEEIYALKLYEEDLGFPEFYDKLGDDFAIISTSVFTDHILQFDFENKEINIE